MPRLFLPRRARPDLGDARPSARQPRRPGASRLLPPCQRARAHLGDLPITLPDDIPVLVDRAHDEVLAPPGPWTRLGRSRAGGAPLPGARSEGPRRSLPARRAPAKASLGGSLGASTTSAAPEPWAGRPRRQRGWNRGDRHPSIERTPSVCCHSPGSPGCRPRGRLAGPATRRTLPCRASPPPSACLVQLTRPGQVDRAIRALEDRCRD